MNPLVNFFVQLREPAETVKGSLVISGSLRYCCSNRLIGEAKLWLTPSATASFVNAPEAIG